MLKKHDGEKSKVSGHGKEKSTGLGIKLVINVLKDEFLRFQKYFFNAVAYLDQELCKEVFMKLQDFKNRRENLAKIISSGEILKNCITMTILTLLK